MALTHYRVGHTLYSAQEATMTMNLRGLTAGEVGDVLAFRTRVQANDAAMHKKPAGSPIQEDDGEFTLYSWNESTTSLGVEDWLREHSLEPVREEDLQLLRGHGYPKDGQAFVALGRGGKRDFDVPVLHHRDGEVRIDYAERVSGSTDDLWYPGADWNPGVIFPAKRKK